MAFPGCSGGRGEEETLSCFSRSPSMPLCPQLSCLNSLRWSGFCPLLGVATAWPSLLHGVDSAAGPVCYSLCRMVNIWPVSVLLHKRTRSWFVTSLWKSCLRSKRSVWVPWSVSLEAVYGKGHEGKLWIQMCWSWSPNCHLPTGWPLTSNFTVPISSLVNECCDAYLVSLWWGLYEKCRHSAWHQQ